jgi:hypothetical protein
MTALTNSNLMSNINQFQQFQFPMYDSRVTDNDSLVQQTSSFPMGNVTQIAGNNPQDFGNYDTVRQQHTYYTSIYPPHIYPNPFYTETYTVPISIPTAPTAVILNVQDLDTLLKITPINGAVAYVTSLNRYYLHNQGRWELIDYMPPTSSYMLPTPIPQNPIATPHKSTKKDSIKIMEEDERLIEL